MKIKLCLYISLLFLALSALGCLKDSSKKIEADNSSKITSQDSTSNVKKKDAIYESFRKVGWITESRYRSLVFIITSDECYKSSIDEIETKIKLAAYNHLQKELNPTTNRNASIQIKNLMDSSGEMIQTEKDCNSENIFFYDIVKKNLKSDFEKIKNIK